jgi:hypothetical protein
VGCIVRYDCRRIYGKSGFNHRGDRAPDDLTGFAREYHSRNMDYHWLKSHVDDTSRHARSVGRSVRQSPTL